MLKSMKLYLKQVLVTVIVFYSVKLKLSLEVSIFSKSISCYKLQIIES